MQTGLSPDCAHRSKCLGIVDIFQYPTTLPYGSLGVYLFTRHYSGTYEHPTTLMFHFVGATYYLATV